MLKIIQALLVEVLIIFYKLKLFYLKGVLKKIFDYESLNGDWGLGIGDWAQSPIPNPQSPIPNPHI